MPGNLAVTTFGNATSDESTQNTTYNTPTAGGSTVGGQGSNALSVSSQSGAISITQESPAAIASLQNVANQALVSIAQTAQGALSNARGISQEALTAAKNALKSQVQQATPLIIGGLVIAVGLAAVLFYSRK